MAESVVDYLFELVYVHFGRNLEGVYVLLLQLTGSQNAEGLSALLSLDGLFLGEVEEVESVLQLLGSEESCLESVSLPLF